MDKNSQNVAKNIPAAVADFKEMDKNSKLSWLLVLIKKTFFSIFKTRLHASAIFYNSEVGGYPNPVFQLQNLTWFWNREKVQKHSTKL